MGSMSASDAAPLPRLGEVFFDVRGSSRSMRLSWYADTGIAVFSIWQGGTCTGTFRLPMDDLPRLVAALRRGMQGGGQDDDPEAREVTGSQRPRRAIGAAPEPFTGALLALGGAGPLPQPGQQAGQPGPGGVRMAPAMGAAGQDYAAGPAHPGEDGGRRSYADSQGYGEQGYGEQGYGEQAGYHAESGGQGYSDGPADGASHQYREPQYAQAQQYAEAPQYDSQRYGAPQDYSDAQPTGRVPSYGGTQGFAAGQSYPADGPPYGAGTSYSDGQQSYGDGRSYSPEQGFPDARPYIGAPVDGNGQRPVTGYPGPGRSSQGYDAQGYDAQGYDAQGYAMPGYAEQVSAGPDYADAGFGNRGYGLHEPRPSRIPRHCPRLLALSRPARLHLS